MVRAVDAALARFHYASREIVECETAKLEHVPSRLNRGDSFGLVNEGI